MGACANLAECVALAGERGKREDVQISSAYRQAVEKIDRARGTQVSDFIH
jgi:hypothetical protein